MIKVKYSTHYKAVLSRIRRLPKDYPDLLDASLKRDAVAFIKTFQAGIEDDTFRLERLKPATVARKRSQGMAKPRAPLYGRGRKEKNSYYNLLRIQKVKRGYRVKARKAKHWKSSLKLDHLFAIHENGAIFQSRGAVIRIPKRPAVSKARNRFFRELKKRTAPEIVRRAISEKVRTGRTTKINREVRLAEREAREHEAGD